VSESSSPLETRAWKATITVSFRADNDEDAYAIADRMLDRALEHPSAVEGEMTYKEIG
jgi:hypothetical protein